MQLRELYPNESRYTTPQPFAFRPVLAKAPWPPVMEPGTPLEGAEDAKEGMLREALESAKRSQQGFWDYCAERQSSIRLSQPQWDADQMDVDNARDALDDFLEERNQNQKNQNAL